MNDDQKAFAADIKSFFDELVLINKIKADELKFEEMVDDLMDTKGFDREMAVNSLYIYTKEKND